MSAGTQPEVRALLERSNRLGSDPRNTNYAGGNASAKAEVPDPVTRRPVELLWVKREVLPEHVAAAVLALVAGDLSLTTGLHVPVDAGVAAGFLR